MRNYRIWAYTQPQKPTNCGSGFIGRSEDTDYETGLPFPDIWSLLWGIGRLATSPPVLAPQAIDGNLEASNLRGPLEPFP
jgi:hypothetical protein